MFSLLFADSLSSYIFFAKVAQFAVSYKLKDDNELNNIKISIKAKMILTVVEYRHNRSIKCSSSNTFSSIQYLCRSFHLQECFISVILAADL